MNVVLRGLVLAAVCGLLLAPAMAAPSAEQREELVAAANAVKKAGELYTAGKFKDSGEAIKDAQARIEKLSQTDDKALIGQLQTLHKRLTRAHALLELEGVKLPELKPVEAAAMPAEPTKPGAPGAPGAAAGGISFTKAVAPVLNARCGGCHVRKASGEFSMANYNDLMRGPKGNRVVFVGDPVGSVLIEKIESGEMPPSGAKIPAAELDLLKKWIAEGAKFDGPDPTATLTSLTPGAAPEQAPMVAVTQATGKETISFAKDIAPIFVASCTGCHGDMRPRNNFSLLTFERLLRGGDRGAPITPGKPAESLLIGKLKGTADGAQMPMNMPPLSTDVIAKIEKWISEGAKYDAPDAKQSIVEVAALAKANAATHEELSADRAKLAASNWRLVMPDSTPDRFESANFLALGNVGENSLAEIGAQAEAIAPKVKEMFKAPSDQPIVKGRMTLFAFRIGYDYNELGKMVERRDIPAGTKGHFRYTIVDAYGAMVPPRADEYSLQGLLAQQIAGVHIAAQGRGVPRWFAEGCGRVAAARFANDDLRVKAWNDAVPQVVSSMKAPDDFMTGKLEQEQTDIASYSFVAFLMKDARRFSQLIDGLRKGGEFNQTFTAAFGGAPNQVAPAWVRKPATAKAIRR